MEDLSGFIAAGFALTGSPGPATLGLAASGAAYGARRSLRFMAGIVAGVSAVMAITACGIVGLVLSLPGVLPVLTVAALAYMTYLAFRIATAPPLSAATGTDVAPKFLAGMVLALTNPKAYAAMVALFSGFVLLEARPVLDGLTKGALLVCIILVVNTLWLGVGAALTRLFRSPRTNRVVNLVFAALLILSVFLALLL